MKLAPVFLLVTLAAPPLAGQSSHRWNTAQIALAATATTEILIDWAQTRQALHQGWLERNPILGPRPSDDKLAAYNIAAIAGTWLIGAVLPHRMRTLWFGAVTGVEGYTIVGNASLGLHVGF